MGDGTQQPHGHNPLDTPIRNHRPETLVYPRESNSSTPGDHQLHFARSSSSSSTLHGAATPTGDGNMPNAFRDPQSLPANPHEYQHYDLYRGTHNSQYGQPYEQQGSAVALSGMNSAKNLNITSGETDPFKAVFGVEPEIRSKSKEGLNSPKFDTKKQLKKWEQDEKLGDLATISPVLYANMVHHNLKNEYPGTFCCSLCSSYGVLKVQLNRCYFHCHICECSRLF